MRQTENSGWVGGVRVSARTFNLAFLSGSILSARAHQFDVIVEENALSGTVEILILRRDRRLHKKQTRPTSPSTRLIGTRNASALMRASSRGGGGGGGGGGEKI